LADLRELVDPLFDPPLFTVAAGCSVVVVAKVVVVVNVSAQHCTAAVAAAPFSHHTGGPVSDASPRVM